MVRAVGWRGTRAERSPVAGQRTFALDLQTPNGAVRGTLPLPDRPVRLSEIVPVAMGIGGQVVAQALRRAADDGRPVTCGPACGACCRQLVPVSVPEAFAVTAAVGALPPDLRERVTERFAATAETLAARPDRHARLMRPPPDDAAAAATARDYFALEVPCPFLEEESCSFHRFRPSICREHNVSSPPALCRDPFANPVEPIPSPLRLSEVLARAHAHLYALPAPRLLPLSLAPTWVADHPDLDRLAWPAGRLLTDLVAAMQRAMVT